jgi:Zn-dependent alcohol dehydrogenase
VLTGVGAVLFAARVAPGSSVLVIGAGGVGQFAAQGARIAGAPTVVVCDPVDARLDAARRAGATHVARPDDLRDVLRDALPDGADYAFDAVGDPATTATASASRATAPR